MKRRLEVENYTQIVRHINRKVCFVTFQSLLTFRCTKFRPVRTLCKRFSHLRTDITRSDKILQQNNQK